MTPSAVVAPPLESPRPPRSDDPAQRPIPVRAAAPPVVMAAVEHLRSRCDHQPTVGLILGTGLGELAEQIDTAAVVPYSDLDGFPCSTALAHKGQFVCGALAGAAVVAMQGRCHLYEGYCADDVTLPIAMLHALGVRTLIVSNAAGGLNPQYETGDVMLIDDHINFMFTQAGALAGAMSFGRPGGGPCGSRRIYDDGLLDIASAIARRHGFAAHRGVYVGVTGPTYETRAEYRMFRRIGGDCVGMSTIPEVVVAAQHGIRVLGISTVTNVARPDTPAVVSCDEVVNVAQQVQPKVRAIMLGVIGALQA